MKQPNPDKFVVTLGIPITVLEKLRVRVELNLQKYEPKLKVVILRYFKIFTFSNFRPQKNVRFFLKLLTILLECSPKAHNMKGIHLKIIKWRSLEPFKSELKN